jgi:serine protease inhibitor
MRIIAAVLLVTMVVVTAGGRERRASPARATSAASNAFAWDLYAHLRTREGNLFFSPYSISAAMSMTREGARETTASQMDAVLHHAPGTSAAGHGALARALKPAQVRDGHAPDAKRVPAYEISIANALWGQDGIAFEKPFTDCLAEAFGAPLRRIDFRQTAAARDRINAWVAKETKKRIQDIVPKDLPLPDTLLALANAIHFKASWQKPFSESATEDATFTTASGGQAKVRMMSIIESFGYVETKDAQIVQLPYREGKMSMIVILPRARDGLSALEARLTPAYLADVLAKRKSTRMVVKLPKFSFTQSQNLIETLPAMGMKDAFIGGKANFTGMTTEHRLHIGVVLHKAFVAVDEAGTEAAAATVVMMLRGGLPSGAPVEFTADHPFAFVIRHEETGCILFMGRLTNP